MSTRTFFTADSHFGHAGMLTDRVSSPRRFHGLWEHDEALVAAWNAAVAPGDMVWHLGDFGMGRTPGHARSVFDRLHGTKLLIVGNHDHAETLALPWAAPPVPYVETVVDSTRLVLCHYPMRAWRGSMRRTIHLHGHTHGLLPDTRRSCDVGVDSWAYRPVRVAEIVKRLAGVMREVEEVLAHEVLDLERDAAGE